MSVVACKLPAGLEVTHNGQTIVLVGSNIGEDLENVSRNGRPNDNERRVAGYGLTELDTAKTAAFEDWVNVVSYTNGKKEDGKLAHPFAALENGSIIGPFKTIDDARKECKLLSSSIETGFEGLDEEEEAKKTGVTKADAKK